MESIFHTELAAFLALKPQAYLMRLLWAGGAFATAMNVESTIARAIALGLLLLTGVVMLFVGFGHGTVGDMLLGAAFLGAAGYAWWFTRY
jgi:hypothetical protein